MHQVKNYAQPAGNTYQSKTEFVYDSAVKKVVVPYPVLVKSHKDSIVLIPAGPIDTAAVVRGFFTKNYYEYQHQDSNISFKLGDSVYLNRIIARQFDYKLLRPVATTTTIVTPMATPRKFSFYVGANFGFDSLTIRQATPKLGIGWKKWRIDGGYNFIDKSKVVGITRDL